MTHLADKVMDMSIPSILSAFWTFSMMGLLTWESVKNHKSDQSDDGELKGKHLQSDSLRKTYLAILTFSIYCKLVNHLVKNPFNLMLR